LFPQLIVGHFAVIVAQGGLHLSCCHQATGPENLAGVTNLLLGCDIFSRCGMYPIWHGPVLA
jgi:hypothetical protein